MITTAITGLIAAGLSALGVDPGLYLVPVWIAVKIIIVTPLVGGGLWWARKKGLAAAAPPPAQPPQDP